MAEEPKRQKEREAYLQSQINDLWRTLPVSTAQSGPNGDDRWPEEPQENLLYFIEKNAPLLEPWQREVVRIVLRIGQYFYPQRQTQVMNEGWATFWHYTLLNNLYDEGMVSDGFMMEFLQSHPNVVMQPPYDAPYCSGINPYALGFAMMYDIRRICEEPTNEDRYWFPDITGEDWLRVLGSAMRNFEDENFIAQYLSPRLMREFHLFAIRVDDREDAMEVTAIHEELGYRALRQALADQYNLGNREPNNQVFNVDCRGERSLTLRHCRHNRRTLGETTEEMLRHIRRLWGFTTRLESRDAQGRVHLAAEC